MMMERFRISLHHVLLIFYLIPLKNINFAMLNFMIISVPAWIGPVMKKWSVGSFSEGPGCREVNSAIRKRIDEVALTIVL